MSKQTVTIYLHKQLSDGYEVVSKWDQFGTEGSYVLIAQQEVTFDLLKTEAELTALAVAGLETQITKTRAEAQAKIQVIEDRIKSLLSITHQAE